jgi:AraC-like DNA-binding protein
VQYRKLFDVPVRFDMPRSAIAFDRHWLDEPVAGSDRCERDRIEGLLLSLEASAPSSASQHVRNALGYLVVGDSPSADRIARALGTTRRTLYRRLAEEGTTVGALRDSVRCELAQQLLCNTRMSLAEIAEALDYSEATAFSRAFKGWTGMAPSGFRARTGKG